MLNAFDHSISGERDDLSVASLLIRYLFHKVAYVAHLFVSSVGFHVRNTDRENFRYAHKDLARGAQNV